jgi:dimethylhistidine N-methyltransferase
MSTPHFDASETTASRDPERVAAQGNGPGRTSSFAEDVAYYLSLTPRQLPSKYLYDELGSAIFEAICHLPWYRIARTEQHLLTLHAREILARAGPLATLIELGPGSGKKLASLVDATGRDRPLTVHLVDVSPLALETAAGALEGGRAAPDLTVVAHQATYEAGLLEISRDGPADGHTMVLFLGSNIGNFDPPGADAFLRSVRGRLATGDCLLLGTDLVRDERDLLLAYDDPLGVTAAFNRNLLVRANRDLGADFDVAGFDHRAVWNTAASRIEMHLVSTRRQRVRVPASRLDITFAAGEAIWTESSYKYRRDDVVQMLERSGFGAVGQWAEDHFRLSLAEAT